MDARQMYSLFVAAAALIAIMPARAQTARASEPGTRSSIREITPLQVDRIPDGKGIQFLQLPGKRRFVLERTASAEDSGK
jgi:hypothetical protein